ncbi:MAG: hypothetical protein ACE5FG_10735 [Myxococcota bacterium]
MRHGALLAAAWVALTLACDSQPSRTAAPSGDEIEVTGVYQVGGITVEERSGAEREIEGTIVLEQQGDRYTARFNLATEFPTPKGSVHSEVIGHGEGKLTKGILEGRAETQIVVAGAPRVDTRFAFIPRRVSTRIVSTSVGRISDDGTLTVEIESQPAEGENYAATRTSLTGRRISTAVGPGAAPDVATPPPSDEP